MKPALPPSVLRALEALFPGDALLVSPEETAVFGADASRKHASPAAVVRPESTEQAAELLKLAHLERVPIYPRGRGTNVVGGCVPLAPGIVVSTSRLNRILDISTDDFLCVCQPGVATGDLQDACKAQGLLYAPDPASARFSSIGGNLAQNAGGMRAVKYGTTRDWVLGLTAVLPGGSVLRTGSRCHKDVAGLDLTRLLVGSEGTLALITQATLKLIPLPEASASLLAVFASEEAAIGAAKAVFAAGILPTALEFLPAEVLFALGKLGPTPWPDGSKAALLLAIDGSEEAVRADLSRLLRAVEPLRPAFLQKARTPQDEEALWEPRRQINQGAYQYGPDKLSDDIAVPRGSVGEAVRRIREIGRGLSLTILAFGHLGDGNLHVNIMHDASDADQARRALDAKQAVLEMTIALGGTISGEHGVGLTKLAWLSRMRGPEAVAAMQAVKFALDPHGIMNPGKAY
ncbi:FAD-binding oxidoreductase [Fundidesulfovibrio putealis]|uniref:FAD-binding oxidoreductase n=1 Tax=Fundidesulfovibrio putealis TaxID=270496 RepID=UPI000423509B|nr:FAD-linked oxidase C-terminal domain-containing protein [Fundidesulfovibrio putealis]